MLVTYTRALGVAIGERFATRTSRRRVPRGAFGIFEERVPMLLQDIRYALRSFRRSPGFATTVVVLVALGIGATTTVFSVVDGILFRQLPYPDAERLVYFDQGAFSQPKLRDWRDQAAWVRIGTEGWPADTYGDAQKPVGGSGGVMPAWPTLTDAQLAAVVMHERELSGADMSEENPDNEDLYAVARGEMTLAEAGLGPDAERSGVTEEDLGG